MPAINDMEGLVRFHSEFKIGTPDYWVVLLTILLFGAAIWQFTILRARFSAAVTLFLVLLRSLALGMAIFFLLEPHFLRERLEKFRPALAVAVDTSQSMGLTGGLSHTRLERVKSLLGDSKFDELGGKYFLEYYSFSDTSHRISPESIKDLQPLGQQTDLEKALGDIWEKSPAALGAVLVFTDGGHKPESENPFPPSSGRGIPVIFVGVGQGENVSDAEIIGVHSAGLAFAGQPARLTVRLRARGFQGRELPLLLKRGEQVILSQILRFSEAVEEREVEMKWVPPGPGTYHLSAEIPSQAEEHIKDNNQLEFTLQAVRDKIRVLLLSGRPGWNYRFLREALKGDPSIDLISFIILRTAADAVNVPEQELSLIPFPTKKIFLEELTNFDILIFDNFSYQPYLPQEYLGRVREFIDSGGAFWMLGGPLAFTAGGYKGNPIEEVLPVNLTDPAEGKGYISERVHPRLTETGRRHPFFQDLGEISPEKLPAFEGYNDAGAVKEGGVVLVDYPFSTHGEQPLLVLGRYGEGRTMAVLTDSLWKWNFELAGRGQGSRFYHTLIRQAVRWSVGDPQLQPVKIELERDHILPGEKLMARLQVLGEDYLPSSDPELEVGLSSRGGPLRSLPFRAEAPGVFIVETEISEPGTFELEATVNRGGSQYGQDRASLTVSWPVGEYRNPGRNLEALREFSARHPGAVLELGEIKETMHQLQRILNDLAPDYRLKFEEKQGLWEQLWVFGLFLAVLGTEWVTRKRCGLE